MRNLFCAFILAISADGAIAEISAERKLALTCLGWQIDRSNLATMISKQHDIRSVLVSIASSDGSEPTQRLIENLGSLIEAAESAYDTSGKSFDTACSKKR